MLPVTVTATFAPFANAHLAQAAAPSGPSMLMQLLPIVLIFVVFGFLILRPQKKQQDVRKKMLEAIQRGDRVLTTGGIYGTVKDVKGDVLVLTIAENVKVEVAKGAITSVATGEG